MSHEIITELFSAICPCLALIWCLQRIAMGLRVQLRGWTLLTLMTAIAVVVLLVPIGGIAIARWIAGVNANFSIPFTGMLIVVVCERAARRELFSRRDWAAGWSFGAVGGLALYPFALGMSSVDPYEWGWRFSPLFVIVGALTGWLLWRQNRFGFLLLLAVIAFHLQLLESTNYWDYLLDPLYCLVSITVLVRRFVNARSHRGLPQAVP